MRQAMRSLFVRFGAQRRRFAFVAAATLVLSLLTVLTTRMSHDKAITETHNTPPADPALRALSVANAALALEEAPKDLGETDRAESLTRADAKVQLFNDPRPETRIEYAADLGVITRDFVHARSSMEEILDRHHGYASRLRMVGHPSGSSLNAMLKVPASEYSSALADLKSIGDVQQDEESADEVVQQRGDLDARLQNAKNNERRLQQLLGESTDKSVDVDYVRRQLVALHAEIVQLELQRHNFDAKVTFSNIHFALREVHETPAETVSAQLRRAAASSLTDLIATLSTLLLFLVSYGPSFLLWTAILFFPARYLWRRTRPAPERAAA